MRAWGLMVTQPVYMLPTSMRPMKSIWFYAVSVRDQTRFRPNMPCYMIYLLWSLTATILMSHSNIWWLLNRHQSVPTNIWRQVDRHLSSSTRPSLVAEIIVSCFITKCLVNEQPCINLAYLYFCRSWYGAVRLSQTSHKTASRPTPCCWAR